MCGITGILNLNNKPVNSAELLSMTQALAHRGPDGNGTHIEGAIGFGHRRLAILDLSDNAGQPFILDGGRYVLVFNGLIYNYRELRSELENLGYDFVSSGDTEVLGRALAVWGVNAIRRLNGMFAFSFWNSETRTLILGRDRYGLKPLYYREDKKTLVFASEVKALLKHSSCQSKIDTEALVEYFTFQNFLGQQTLFKDIRLLSAGHYMLADMRGEPRISTHQYWDFEFSEPENPANDNDYVEQLDALMQQAVQRHLVSDVPVSTFLSGGVDTSLIAAMSATHVGSMNSFTVGFDMNSISGLEVNFDEREKAEHLASQLQFDHYQTVLKHGDMEKSLANIVWHLEEPRVGQCYPNYYASRLASKFNKVVLSGVGGDEIFAGYPWRYLVQSPAADETFADAYYRYWQRLIPPGETLDIFSPIRREVQNTSTQEMFRSVLDGAPNNGSSNIEMINSSLYFEAKTFLHGLLVVDDKISMAHGLEFRAPFLDNDLVDFAMRLPLHLKLSSPEKLPAIDENKLGQKRQTAAHGNGKLILRRVLERYISSEIATRPKQGFSGPDASWFRGSSLKMIERVLGQKDAYIFEYLDRSTVWRLVEDHLQGRQNRRLLIWSLLYVEIWIKKFIVGEPSLHP